MAEYVRRKRPPASHSYWARLHDLTHPPAMRSTFTCLGLGGLVAGAYCGTQESMTFASAMRQANECSLYLAGFFAIGGFFTTISDRRPGWRWSTLGAAFLMAAAVFVIAFLFAFFLFSAMLTFRWLTGGLGWGYGASIGVFFGVLTAGLFAYSEQRQWQRRCRRWPRWDIHASLPPTNPTPVLGENPFDVQWTPPTEPVSQPELPVRGNATHVA
jgi:hypothetical protein